MAIRKKIHFLFLTEKCLILLNYKAETKLLCEAFEFCIMNFLIMENFSFKMIHI